MDAVKAAAPDPAVAEALRAAELADRGEAAAGPAAAVPAGEAPPIDEAAQWIEAAQQFGRTARELLPKAVREEWTEERLAEFGRALARCAVHYGWTVGGLVKHPLVGLAFAAFPLAWPIARPYVQPYIAQLAPAAPAASPPAPVSSAEPDAPGG